jgi:hypothetical protein
MSIQESKLTNGPINDENGFPFWYKDKNNLSLELCLNPNDPMCLPPPGNIDPTKPIVFPGNFPEEGFYWAGSASATAPGNINAELVMAIEQAFLNEVPKAEDRVVFARIRVRADNLDPGQYRVIHPYGVLNFTVTVKDKRNINFTDDFGFVPNTFSAATTGSIGPFLVWDETLPAAPAGYIGDPNVLHTVTGSPFNQNFFKIEKVGAETSTVLMTDQFSISGKKAVLRVSAGPTPGSYKVLPKVTLSASSPEAQITYTTDGSDPLEGVVYTGPLTLSGSDVTVRALARLGSAVSEPISVNFRQDLSAPTVAAFPPEGAYPSTQVVTLTASEGSTRIFYTLDGTDPRNPFYRIEYSQPFMLVAPTTRILKYYAIDGAGNESPVMTGTYTFQISDTPGVGLPMPAMVASLDTSVVNDESLMNISWQAEGGASFNVQKSVNGGPFQNVNLFLQTSTSLPLSLANGSRYQFRVQSIDGNWSASTYALGEEFTLSSFQESDDDIVYAGRWQGRNLAEAFDRKTNYSSTVNSTATFTFTGRMISLIGVARPSGGIAEILIDGVKVDTVDFYADSVKAARSLYVNNSLQAGSHTIQIRVIGQRNPLSVGNVVELDGFTTLR